jgi:3(or 17)beta-hydroxysteroid dehydrogenase
MMGRFERKVVIVTGAASGLGAATVQLFASEGAIVVLSDVDVKNGQAAAQAIGGQTSFRAHDVSLEGDWERIVAAAVQDHGGLDILVNNAGVFEVGNIESQTVEQWDRVIAVAAKGTFLGCKHAIRAMRTTGGGAIVNVASIASFQGMPYAAAYCAAKGAVEALTRSAAVHCAEMQYAIRCNSVHPGPIDTPMTRAITDQIVLAAALGMEVPPRVQASTSRADPSEIAEAILFLSSESARGVNGARLVVDNAKSVMSVISGVVRD